MSSVGADRATGIAHPEWRRSGDRSSPSTCLDFASTKDDADHLTALVPATHTVSWYDAGQNDRAAWLTEKLAAK